MVEQPPGRPTEKPLVETLLEKRMPDGFAAEMLQKEKERIGALQFEDRKELARRIVEVVSEGVEMKVEGALMELKNEIEKRNQEQKEELKKKDSLIKRIAGVVVYPFYLVVKWVAEADEKSFFGRILSTLGLKRAANYILDTFAVSKKEPPTQPKPKPGVEPEEEPTPKPVPGAKSSLVIAPIPGAKEVPAPKPVPGAQPVSTQKPGQGPKKPEAQPQRVAIELMEGANKERLLRIGDKRYRLIYEKKPWHLNPFTRPPPPEVWVMSPFIDTVKMKPDGSLEIQASAKKALLSDPSHQLYKYLELDKPANKRSVFSKALAEIIDDEPGTTATISSGEVQRLLKALKTKRPDRDGAIRIEVEYTYEKPRIDPDKFKNLPGWAKFAYNLIKFPKKVKKKLVFREMPGS